MPPTSCGAILDAVSSTVMVVTEQHIMVIAGLCLTLVENPCGLQPCGNRGLCQGDRKGNYSCACKVGHTGKDCERDLLPPSGLHVLRVEEEEVVLRWDLPDPSSQSLVSLIHTFFYLTH
uniref:EGF-like domain-containing protein n=1 Tax=Hucho hucho TaxID=62062 RepID=A0A4W5LE11_9TELE